MSYKNKEDQAASAKRHYEANKDKMKERAKVHSKIARQKTREFINELKSVPCADCGICFPPYVMDFDHINGDKEFNIANAVGRGYSNKRILLEIDKCDIVCANCHRIRTFNRSRS